MMKVLSLLSLAALAPTLVHSHATKYPHVEANRAQLTKLKDDGDLPPILSWHVHITYFLTNPDNIQAALDLRTKAAEHFAPYMGDEYDGRYDYGVLVRRASLTYLTALFYVLSMSTPLFLHCSA